MLLMHLVDNHRHRLVEFSLKSIADNKNFHIEFQMCTGRLLKNAFYCLIYLLDHSRFSSSYYQIHSYMMPHKAIVECTILYYTKL